MSVAEREWRVDVEWREEEARKEQRRVDEVAVRVAQLAALHDKRSKRAAGQSRELQLGSVELGRLQAELSGQTRSIEELMADVREIRQQLTVREKKQIDMRQEEAENGHVALAAYSDE